MENYKQLELFDLSLYTSDQSMDVKENELEESFKNIAPLVEYKQLELDLFPGKSELICIEFVRLAA